MAKRSDGDDAGGTLALDTRVIGHRGAAAYAPENTLAGLREARRRGCRWVEIDVRLTRDAVPVLMHDPALDRTTSGRGELRDHDADTVAGLDAGRWFGETYRSERPPRLDEALALLRELGLKANIEIKPTAGSQREKAHVIGRALLADPHRREVVQLVSSFSEEILAGLREVAPEIPRGLLLRRPEGDWPAVLRRLRCVSVHLWHGAVEPQVIETARREGVKVLVFTVNSPERARELFDLGVDAVITDVPDRIQEVAATVQ